MSPYNSEDSKGLLKVSLIVNLKSFYFGHPVRTVPEKSRVTVTEYFNSSVIIPTFTGTVYTDLVMYIKIGMLHRSARGGSDMGALLQKGRGGCKRVEIIKQK